MRREFGQRRFTSVGAAESRTDLSNTFKRVWKRKIDTGVEVAGDKHAILCTGTMAIYLQIRIPL